MGILSALCSILMKLKTKMFVRKKAMKLSQKAVTLSTNICLPLALDSIKLQKHQAPVLLNYQKDFSFLILFTL